MPGQLVDPRGRPISSADFQPKNKKAAPPALGERYGRWAGPDAGLNIMGLPGGGAIAFDPSHLTLADFRQMKSHYQINSSLSVLTFMMHQMEYHIDCDRKDISEHVAGNLYDVWSRFVRAQSQSLWAGFSPNALQWENDVADRKIVLTKIKDLVPEDCRVHWKKIEQVIPGTQNGRQTFSVYDGIEQFGQLRHIPVENSYWYPLLMDNGNYYGKRILESAFQPWFFSMLMHLFANRYYERFGEPIPVGRAPYEDEIDVQGTSMRGNQLMGMILQNLRNRSTVILPNEKTPFGDETNPGYDYQIEYLESQMRGADFERYMTRLDEEMSLAMFTPLLMMRTADVGSYNLGTQHTQVYQWMLNAISGDWADYINKYIIRPMVAFNFGINAPVAKIKFTKMGKVDAETLRAIISALISKDAIKIDTVELGEMAGLTIKEIQAVTEDPSTPPKEVPPADPTKNEASEELRSKIINRVEKQIKKAFREKTFGTDEFACSLGYMRRLENAFRDERLENPESRVRDLYDMIEEWLKIATDLGVEEFKTPENFMGIFDRTFSKYFEIVKR